MAFSDHIATCNAHNLSNFLPLMVEGDRIGWVHRRWLPLFAAFPDILCQSAGQLSFHPSLTSPQARSAATDRLCAALADHLPPPRGERFAACRQWGGPVVLHVDRAYASLFGIGAFGVHVNGLVPKDDGLWLWVAKRAADRQVAPGKLDNLIAGGQPLGLSIQANLAKEAAEEANVPPDMLQQARPVGCISYCLEDEWGLKPDTMFCFDVLLPPDFVPQNMDGEIDSFTLMPLAEVAERVRTTTDFKFNVNLVILDLLMRHGILHPDSEPDYAGLCVALRRQLPP